MVTAYQVGNPFAEDTQFIKDSIRIQVMATVVINEGIKASSFRKDFIDFQRSELTREGIITT